MSKSIPIATSSLDVAPLRLVLLVQEKTQSPYVLLVLQQRPQCRLLRYPQRMDRTLVLRRRQLQACCDAPQPITFQSHIMKSQLSRCNMNECG